MTELAIQRLIDAAIAFRDAFRERKRVLKIHADNEPPGVPLFTQGVPPEVNEATDVMRKARTKLERMAIRL